MAQTNKGCDQFWKWRKLWWPLKSLRYYPPQFVLRDPVVEGVTEAFKQGNEVAIIVFNVTNMKEMFTLLTKTEYERFQLTLKRAFRDCIEQELKEDQLIVLHDFYSDGVTLFIKIEDEQQCIVEMDVIIKTILKEMKLLLEERLGSLQVEFETGYMFVDNKQYTVQEAIVKAQQQALTMAEKKAESEFNELLHALTRIVCEKDIRLLAQPIIDVATKEVRAWEMLTRGPEGTPYVNPLHLFAIARQTGLLYDLELIVLEKTLEQIESTGCEHDIFINFTPLSIGNERFISDLKQLMNQFSNILPTQITLEVTERDSMEGLEFFIRNIQDLRKLGFRIAVDDTGAGYASLNTISELLPDIIKIDRSVIQDIDKNSLKESMLKGLLLVAREAGSIVVAEGIESEEEASVLSRNHVDLAQGYLFAKPATLLHGLASV